MAGAFAWWLLIQFADAARRKGAGMSNRDTVAGARGNRTRISRGDNHPVAMAPEMDTACQALGTFGVGGSVGEAGARE